MKKREEGNWGKAECALKVDSLSQSHKEMMEMKPEINTEADCARFCVNARGGRFVLQAKERVHKLDTQVLGEKWAGQKVKFVGTLDLKTNTIAVETLEAIDPSPTSTRPHLYPTLRAGVAVKK